ncbi:hypothetical protein FO519_004832 [Halicephalobus sp. NKZ332]|nr:hypothetical protein FO519_004832 [Halicephalobus sp. NKZ332]
MEMSDDPEITDIVGNPDEYIMETECSYNGTEYLHIKIYLIGVFGTMVALLNMFFNSFYTLVFVKNKSLRSSPLYYFGILAILDIILAINYILLMSVPVYFDQFGLLWLYHLFLGYLVPMMTISNTAMFGSMLLILMATVERLLRTSKSPKVETFRHFLEGKRPVVCFICISFAFLYKLCTYFELAHAENSNCTEWSRYDVIATPLAMHPDYRFWWMFLTRNVFDRVLPFIALILMNVMIIRTLKKEQNNNKSNLKDATRALIALVSLYIVGQTLQVTITVWEFWSKPELEHNYAEVYSYINDIMSLAVLISSTIRFPVYCSCNQEIYDASKFTYNELKACFFASKKRNVEYLPITIKESSQKDPVYKSQIEEVQDNSLPEKDPSGDESTTTWML